MRKTKQIFYALSFLGITLLFLNVFSEHLYMLNKVDRLVSWENLYLRKNTNLISPGSIQKASQQEITSDKPECFKDRYSVEEIQKEIDEILSETHQNELYNDTQQKWRGIPLNGLPLGHVNYFFQADSVLSEAIDVSQCRTASCVFNTIYKKPEGAIEGHVAFLFFLKTGYTLSGIRDNPDDEVDISAFNELSLFYFKDEEFYRIWLWLQSTSGRMFHLPGLQNIYRLAHEQRVRIGEEPVCGRAGIGRQWLWLGDRCLTNQSTYNADKEWWKEEGELTESVRGEALESIAHEIAHYYDYNHRDEEYTRLSAQISFLELSHWQLREYNNDDELVEREWGHEGQVGYGFISDYAKTSPIEDFAESLAAFRYYPETLKEAAPEKFEYFKENVFEGISYDWEGINELINSQVLSLIQSEKRQWLSTCLSEQESNNYNNSFTLSGLAEEVKKEFTDRGFDREFNCFMSNMDISVESLIARFKFELPEGCYIFSHREKDWWHGAVFREVIPSLIEDLEDEERVKEIANQIQAFRNQFKRSFKAEEIAIDCYQEKSSNKPFSPQQCFESKRDYYIGQIIVNYSLIGDTALSNELTRLNEIYSYSTFHQSAVNRVRRVMQISSSDMAAKADELINNCSQSQYYHDDQSLLFSPYKGLDNVTLRPWFLNCINQNYEQTLTGMLERARGGYITLDREFQRFIYGIQDDEFLPILENSVQRFVDQDSIVTRIRTLKQETLTSLKQDSNWYLERDMDESLLDACLQRSRQLLDSYAVDNLIFNPTPTLSVEVCSHLQEEEPYKSMFSQRLARLYGDVFGEYINIVSQQWILAEQECESSRSCLLFKLIPVLHRSWRMLGEDVTAEYTRKETRRMIRRALLEMNRRLIIANQY